MSAHHGLPGSSPRDRDLAENELWRRSLARSRHRRRLAAEMRQRAPRRKGASLAVTASMVVAPAAPTFAAVGGAGRHPAPTADDTNTGKVASGPRLLHEGDTGIAVADLQRELNRRLPHDISVDGYFGPKTRAAVAVFQRARGLHATGVVDTGTWIALFPRDAVVAAPSQASGQSGSAGPPVAQASSAGSASDATSSEPASGDAVPATGGDGPVAAAASADGTVATTRAVASLTGDSAKASVKPIKRPSAPRSRSRSKDASKPSASSPASGDSKVVVFHRGAPKSGMVLDSGIALPLPRQYLRDGSIDEGVDYSAPGGTPLFAMGDGVVIQAGIPGFGPNAIVLKITSGPLKGRMIYYGHSGPNVVKVGQHVRSGQQISIVGYGIVGISTGPHLEIGFWPTTGDFSAGGPMKRVIDNALGARTATRAYRTSTVSYGGGGPRAASTAHSATRSSQARARALRRAERRAAALTARTNRAMRQAKQNAQSLGSYDAAAPQPAQAAAPTSAPSGTAGSSGASGASGAPGPTANPGRAPNSAPAPADQGSSSSSANLDASGGQSDTSDPTAAQAGPGKDEGAVAANPHAGAPDAGAAASDPGSAPGDPSGSDSATADAGSSAGPEVPGTPGDQAPASADSAAAAPPAPAPEPAAPSTQPPPASQSAGPSADSTAASANADAGASAKVDAPTSATASPASDASASTAAGAGPGTGGDSSASVGASVGGGEGDHGDQSSAAPSASTPLSADASSSGTSVGASTDVGIGGK